MTLQEHLLQDFTTSAMHVRLFGVACGSCIHANRPHLRLLHAPIRNSNVLTLLTRNHEA